MQEGPVKEGQAQSSVEKPRIRHLCSLGTLEGYAGKKGEWSTAKKLKKIRKAGFHGFLGRLSNLTPEVVAESGLIFACTTSIGKADEAEVKLRTIKEYGAACVNIHLQEATTPIVEAVTTARTVMACADRMSLDASIEVHRDTCTQTLEKAYALADRFEKAEKRLLKLTWDFSHPAVSQRLSPPFWIRLGERPDLMQWANQYHFRPFNGHHAQVPALGTDGKLTPEFVDYMEFADRSLANWLQKAGPGRELYACQEQTARYWLSTFGDRLADAQVVGDHIARSFKAHRKQWAAPESGYPKGV
jgi:hypothetical protein